MKTKIFIITLMIVLLTACGSQATETPASQPTEKIVPATKTVTYTPPPTDTAVPPTNTPTETPTEEPTLEPASATTGISFANEIMPIIQSRCINCHGGQRLEEGLSMRSYADLMAGSDNGPVINAGDADGSLLAEMLIQNKMPKKGPKLTPPQVQLIIDWINQGALNN